MYVILFGVYFLNKFYVWGCFMKKQYVALALLMSISTFGLMHAGIIIQTGSDECASFNDVQNEKLCKTRGNPQLPGKCVSDTDSHGTQYFACRYEDNGSTFSTGSRSKNSRGTSGIRVGPDLNENSNTPVEEKNQSVATDFPANVFSQDIHAPIYNIPMQRSLVPLSYGTIDCPWFFSVAPYGKTMQKQAIGDAKLENIEAGSMIQAGYYGSYWFANTIVAVGGTKTDANITDVLNASHWHIGFTDALFALGLKTNSDRYSKFAANGELFFGVSSNRLDGDNVKDSTNKFLFNVGNPSVGVQGDIDWTFAQFNTCKFALSAFSRFTHFFSKDISAGNNVISYTPGSFVDALLGLTQFYGSDYQHQFEIGYNPTVRVIKAQAVNPQNQPAANLYEPETGKLYNTAYAMYSYNWEANGMPMMFSLGGSATVTPHATTYGTIFGTFGLSF